MLSKLKFSWALLMSFSLLLVFSACNKDDDDVNMNQDKTIVEIAGEDARFSTLVSALQRTGLDAVLSDKNADFTVFAPTNAAFTSLGVDLNMLTDEALEGILLYHVLGASVLSTQIQEGKTYVGTASNTGPDNTSLSLLIERSGSSLSINNTANVTSADLQGVNGVIHVIDDVLLPLDIVGHVMANDDFTQLTAALGAASGDLVNVLKTANQTFTVFAPINSAFEAISSITAGLTADQLASVLTYHVVAGANVLSNTLVNNQEVTTVQTEKFTIGISGNIVTITDASGGVANILLTDVQATNGVVHIIDKVIIPNTL